MMWRLMVVLLLCSCSTSSPRIRVDLRTDYAPILEVQSVRSRIWRDEARTDLVYEELRNVPQDGTAFTGFRVVDVELEAGMRFLSVELQNAAGEIVADRGIVTDIRGDTGLTVLVTRSCEGVMCPAADRNATECLGGRCVSPACTLETPEECPEAMCASDSDCPTTAGTCAEAVCVSGTCASRPRDDRCPSGQLCHPQFGCVSPPGDASTDAGTDAAFDSAPSDARVDVPTGCVPSECPGSCMAGDCVIVDPTDAVTCPPGVPCEVRCESAGTCLDTIDCGASSSCRVRCEADDSCPNVRCSQGECEVRCPGARSCDSVSCETDGSCHMECQGAGACRSLTCGPGACELRCDDGACTGSVDCSTSCFCDVECSTTCAVASCPAGCQDGPVCNASLDGCDRCL